MTPLAACVLILAAAAVLSGGLLRRSRAAGLIVIAGLAAAAGDIVRLPPGDIAVNVPVWSPLLTAIGLLGAGVPILTALLWAFRLAPPARTKTGRGLALGCGFAASSARMQYTGSSYPVPVIRVFSVLLGTNEEFRPPKGYWPAKAFFGSFTPDPALERGLPVLVPGI